MNAKINERCPLQSECERKCTYKHRENECDYYIGNNRPGNEILDQKRPEPDYEAWIDADDSDGAFGAAGHMVYLPVDKLDPHPDNPRGKSLGDLTELADSIKINGIFQNLTVVPWFSSITRAPLDDPEKQADAGWRVVIGHRRLAAAKLAGLETVPCVITEMTQAEQVRTMLMENMQRSDLTAYEQAQGFQMMMNLGDSVDDIASKTGFSESTVRRRVRLLKLDPDKFKAAESRGASMWEYAELDKIEDDDKRNAVLEKVGTDNFKYEIKRALDNQASKKKTALLVEKVSSFATEIKETDGYHQVKSYNAGTTTPDDIEIPDNATEVEYFFTIREYGYDWIYIYRQGTPEVDQETESERAKREAAIAAREERVALLNEISKRMYQLRHEYAKTVSSTAVKKNIADIATAIIWENTSSYGSIDLDECSQMLGFELADDDDDDYTEELDFTALKEAVQTSPERALWILAYLSYGNSERECYHGRWDGAYRKNADLDRLYDLLITLGYKQSDEEKAVRDGTHELFSDSIKPVPEPEDPCALCKSAHPSCDECCATCEDSCNGSQVCRKQSE